VVQGGQGLAGHRPGFKRKLSELVGWASGREGVLGSKEAYEVVYGAIYEALAGC